MKSEIIRVIPIVIAATTLLSCSQKPDLSSDKAKYSFSLGHQIGENMKRQEIELDLDAFKAGVAEGIKGENEIMSVKERVESLKKMTKMLQKKKEEKGTEE